MNIKEINWEILFKRYPERYLRVFDEETKELAEVHDRDNGSVWIRIKNNEWMCIE